MSGGVRAEWHLADLADDADPFEAVMYSPGVAIDLNASDEELGERLVGMLLREGRLADTGLRCALKDGGQDCLTCSEATLDPEERLSRLCRLGKDQAAIERRFNERTDERLAPLRELVAEVDAATEVVGAEMDNLPPELAELLTSVGL